MTDEHAKGAVNKALGKVAEGLGRLTGNRRQQDKGKQIQGVGQERLGDIQDAVRRPTDKP